MRNWNKACPEKPWGNTTVWSLPMRNWNVHLIAKISRQKCLKPTYEELKLSYLDPTSDNFFVWSLPMRNWNLEQIASINSDIISLKPTYEELKLPWVSKKGNVSLGLKPTYEELKRSPSELIVSIISFEAYLWGIETPVFSPIMLLSFLSLKPTYEELKLCED